MRYRMPHKDWKRCLNCGRFTDPITDACEKCGDSEQVRTGGWVSDYYNA